MKIGILQTGAINPDIAEGRSDYPVMFEDLLRPALPEARFETHAILDGAPLPEIDAADAWLVTGSRFGVYDPEPWIAPLSDFLRRAYAAAIPLIGVCFGHQILAEALGGRVVKSEKGWGAGLHRYALTAEAPFMAGDGPESGDAIALHAMHQDQVVEAPPGARVIARSEFCEIAGLAYGPIDRPIAMSVQGHPEFDASFEHDLVELRRRHGMDPSVADAAIHSLSKGAAENARAARWIAQFLRAALEPEAGAAQ